MLFTVRKKPPFHFPPFEKKKGGGTNPRTPNPFTTKGKKNSFGTLKGKNLEGEK